MGARRRIDGSIGSWKSSQFWLWLPIFRISIQLYICLSIRLCVICSAALRCATPHIPQPPMAHPKRSQFYCPLLCGFNVSMYWKCEDFKHLLSKYSSTTGKIIDFLMCGAKNILINMSQLLITVFFRWETNFGILIFSIKFFIWITAFLFQLDDDEFYNPTLSQMSPEQAASYQQGGANSPYLNTQQQQYAANMYQNYQGQQVNNPVSSIYWKIKGASRGVFHFEKANQKEKQLSNFLLTFLEKEFKSKNR